QTDAAMQHLACAKTWNQSPGPAGTENTQQVNGEQQANHRGREVEGLTGQAKTNVVEQCNEAAHQQKGQAEQNAQARIAQMQGEVAQQATHGQRLSREMSRRRQQPEKQPQRQQPQPGDSAQRPRPAADIAEQAGQQAPEQAAQRRATDIQAHRGRQRLGVKLLTDIGHGQCRQTAQRQPQQRAQEQQAAPFFHQRASNPQHRRQAQRCRHHRLAPPAFGQRAGYQQAQRQAQGSQRQSQAAAGGRHTKV